MENGGVSYTENVLKHQDTPRAQYAVYDNETLLSALFRLNRE